MGQAKIVLKNNCGINWISDSSNSVYVKGYAFENNELFTGGDLADYFKNNLFDEIKRENYVKVKRKLFQLNGSYACVCNKNENLFAVVDRLRSIPLFYGIKSNYFFISDDAHFIKNNVKDTYLDEISVKEFLLTGYVSRKETLFPNVKQLQAGEAVSVDTRDGTFKVTTHRYYRFVHENFFDASKEELYLSFDRILNNIFKRLITLTEGRTIVIPLSGGFDSRLIACLLKRYDRKDVICFSYGKVNNSDSEINKQVAEKLGYRWIFVPYTRRSWYKWYQSPEIRKYFTYSNGLSSIPHIQDWPAVWELKKANKIPKSSVFIPGHSGDFVAGSHIPHSFAEVQVIGIKKLVKEICKKHYSLWDWTNRQNIYAPIFEQKILQILLGSKADTPEEAANSFEMWDWQERQSKFIVNSCRVYEYWGYDWKIPLWDNDIMTFWQMIPLELRLKKKLYNNYFLKFIFKEFKLDRLILKTKKWEHRIFRDPRYGRHHPLSYLKCLLLYHKNFGTNINSVKKFITNTMLAYNAIHDLENQ